MIPSQIPAVHPTLRLAPLAIAPPALAPVTITPAAPAPRAASPPGAFDGMGSLVRRGALVVLLIPILLPVAMVGLLVPWCLRVPVCGPPLPRHR